ncbi:MAG: DUF1428 domain-containing protein [Pseudomonadota bacterium]
MSYVEGFVLPVPNSARDAYIEHARYSGEIFKEYGMVSMVECWGDDVPEGKLTSFPLAVKLQADETVVFSWVVWPDKATRDAGWEKIMADPRMNDESMAMPFDGKRMIFGGFVPVVEM